MSEHDNAICAQCGMPTGSPASFHPFAACLMFKQTRDSRVVEANLRFVWEQGVKTPSKTIDLEKEGHGVTARRLLADGP